MDYSIIQLRNYKRLQFLQIVTIMVFVKQARPMRGALQIVSAVLIIPPKALTNWLNGVV